jgi:hypothetical protein
MHLLWLWKTSCHLSCCRLHPTQFEWVLQPIFRRAKNYASFPIACCNASAGGRLPVGATAAVDFRAERFFRNAANTTCDTAASGDNATIAALGCDSCGNSASGLVPCATYANRFIRDHGRAECHEQRVQRQGAGIHKQQCTAASPITAQN